MPQLENATGDPSPAPPASVQVANLSVVIPVYDEEPNIAPLAQEVVDALDGRIEFELIFVDDGSSDRTAAEVRRFSEGDSRVRLVALATNSGQSAATVAGVRAARYQYAATLDGDGQNDPADLPTLLDAIDAEHPVAIGRRRRRKDSWLRRFSSRVGNGARQLMLRDGASDTGCALKLFPREAFLKLPAFRGMHRFLPALFKFYGFPWKELPVNHRPRRAGYSKYGVWNRLFRGIYDLIGVRWIRRRAIRLPRVATDES